MKMENVKTFLYDARYSHHLLDGFWLKIIGFVFTLIDHVGLLFFKQIGENNYDILRSVGRIALPIFILLSIEGVYYTKCYWKYFLRLFLMAVLLDASAYVAHFALGYTEIIPGNIFMDLALGTLIVYLFKRNDVYTMLSIPVMGYFVLSDFSIFNLGSKGLPLYGISTDYGTYGLCLFLGFFLAYYLTEKAMRSYSDKNGLDFETLAKDKLRLYLNLSLVFALVVVVGVFTFIEYFAGNSLPILPSIGMRIESWACMAFPFILLYDGYEGLKNRIARYSLYWFYPLHLLLLFSITFAF